MSDNGNFNNETPVNPTGEPQNETWNETPGAAPSEPTGAKTTGDSWQEVGKQFQALGQSIAQAMRTAWENEETQRQLRDMRSGLESMVQEVGKAIDESTSSPQGQKIRAEVGKTAESLRTAGAQTAQEVRPKLVEALRQLNTELQKFIEKMESKTPPPPGPDSQA